jgi:hypothetical protein
MLEVGGWRFWDLEIGVALPLGLTASSAGGAARAGVLASSEFGRESVPLVWRNSVGWRACGGGPVGKPTILSCLGVQCKGEICYYGRPPVRFRRIGGLAEGFAIMEKQGIAHTLKRTRPLHYQ